jgi:methionyl-tRNA formyltransferase
MRVVFIGCVDFSRTALQTVLEQTEAEVVGIVTRKATRYNADFCSLEPLAREYDIPYLLADQANDTELVHWLKERKPDVVYCFGWSYLLSKEVISIPPLGVIGYHPAALPKNRGRHPIIWTLALGLSETASTFFFMDEGVDSGDILSQVVVPVAVEDDASTLYKKLSTVAVEQIRQFTHELARATYQRIPQDHSIANYWRKRKKKDGEIDWRMSATSIYNLVRALTRPYVGAHCVYEGNEVKIWRTQVIHSHHTDYRNIEPGKVVKVEGSSITVKCGEGLIKILEHEFVNLPSEGCYL